MKVRRERAFTLLEMTLVLMLAGALMAMGLPMLELLVQQNKLQDERAEVGQAGRALLGFALARDGFPDYPVDGASGQRRLRELPTAALGLKARGRYAKPLYYDFNEALIEGEGGGICARLLSQIENQAPAGVPRPLVCAANRCSGEDARFTPAGVVVISKGPNYRLDGLNGGGERRYENPARGFGGDYEDIMVSYSLYELAAVFGCTAKSTSGLPPPIPGEESAFDVSVR